MRSVKVFIAMSLDNFIATENEQMEWLEAVEGQGDNGYTRFYDTIDTIIVGRHTIEWLKKVPNLPFPYHDKTCYAISTTPQPHDPHFSWINNDFDTFLHDLKYRQGGDIWLVGGGQLIRSALNAQLVDEVILTIAPVLLGKGVPLFTGVLNMQHLRLRASETFGQFVELRYEVIHPAPPPLEKGLFEV
ncbi:dihydrofolate reductase family protein [Caryophanon tenue]|uniref:Bacterial bifunctional deaminase-reductase C-terminal domain-containing protein n=1 Tax=Caryophanon tenue TaxID=33978 RepID=A0A1C0Y760_9BACL|nr:dihydrofolate reductase family protein [Caryophanon tenue]OCS83017.1 hypothetical protein A6M13_06340 [Caryophanon tenue]